VTVGDLPEALKAHRLWLKSDGKQGILADLNFADLSGADLFQADLSGANLIGANLIGADLNLASLFQARLSEANLSKARLIGADLIGADLSGADLSGADLSGARLIGARLIGARLSRAYLMRANLMEAYLYQANLSEAYLIEANLSGAYLIEANLGGADLIEANLSEARLIGADLRGVDLKGADLINSDLHQADISGACLDDATTSRWNIEGIICTHLVTGPDRKRIDYAPGEFEQKHTHLENLSEIVLNLPFSELTFGVGLMTESAINQHQPSIPIRFKGQEALSDKTTKLSFIVFASDDDEVRKTQDQLDVIEQNLTQLVEDKRQPKGVLGWANEILLGPSWFPLRTRLAEIERILTKRYNQLAQIFKKVWGCIRSSFPV
jgi:uncharacterized protein YjbI with pentapeptide repeats